MALSAAAHIWYVYGIVPASFSPATLPSGLDDADVKIERGHVGRAAALTSTLDAARYTPEALESSSGDVEWLSPRAVAHDRVLTWASDLGPVVPLPMFSMFSTRDAVQTMLAERAEQLAATLDRLTDGREYALRVYRVDRELLAAVDALSPRVAELAAAAAAASPGQRYLLERKLETERKSELRAVTQRLIDDLVEELSVYSASLVRSPVPRAVEADGGRGVMVLNAAFFVAPDMFQEFQKTLTSIIDREAARGLRFDFTGPWPPYHFAGTTVEAAERGA
jgi:hypothetical protein